MTPSEWINAADAFSRLAAKQRISVIQAVAIAEWRQEPGALKMFEAHVIERAHAYVVTHFTSPEDAGRWRLVAAALRDELDARLGLADRRAS